MDFSTAFKLINNLDLNESERKLASRWSIITADRSGRIIEITRFNEEPAPAELHAEMKRYPNSIQLTVQSLWYAKVSELEKAVEYKSRLCLEDVFILINSLDISVARRKYGPTWSCVAVDSAGKVLNVIRNKHEPDMFWASQHMDMYPKSVQFTARPGDYSTILELKKKIQDCVWLHKHDKKLRGKRGLTRIDGKNVYISRNDEH